MSHEISCPSAAIWDFIEREFHAFSVDWSNQLFSLFYNNQIPLRVLTICDLITACESELKYSRNERDYIKIYLCITTIHDIMFDNVG
jgi:hypothetical protein